MIGLGIAAALLAAVANALAVVFQAQEARNAPESEGMHVSLIRRLAHRRRWLAGVGLLVGAGIMQLVALGLAPIAIVQPTLSTSQLALLAMARIKLDERVGLREWLAALVLLAGLAMVIIFGPRHSIVHASAGRLAPPLAAVGGAAVVLFLIGRMHHHRARLSLVLGAGLAFAWSDFMMKLLSNELAAGRWPLAMVWIAATVLFGAVAFLEENSALQYSPAVTVAPVIGAIKVPVPVLMALWTGVETWGASSLRVSLLVFGLLLVAAGAAVRSRSEAVTRMSSSDERERRHRRPPAGLSESEPEGLAAAARG